MWCPTSAIGCSQIYDVGMGNNLGMFHTAMSNTKCQLSLRCGWAEAKALLTNLSLLRVWKSNR